MSVRPKQSVLNRIGGFHPEGLPTVCDGTRLVALKPPEGRKEATDNLMPIATGSTDRNDTYILVLKTFQGYRPATAPPPSLRLKDVRAKRAGLAHRLAFCHA